MAEATVHTFPTQTQLVEDIHTVFDDVRSLYTRHHSVVLGSLVAVGCTFVQRKILRRELRHLSFIIELPFDLSPETMPDYFGSE